MFFFFETPQTEKFAGHDETTTAEEDAFLYEVIDVIDDAENTLLKENVLPSKYQCPGVKKCQISIFLYNRIHGILIGFIVYYYYPKTVVLINTKFGIIYSFFSLLFSTSF